MELKTYRIDSARKQPALRRLMALARALTHDMIAPDAGQKTLQKILDAFDREILAMKKSGKFDELSKSFKDFALKTLTIEYSGDSTSAQSTANTLELSEHDLDTLFKRAGDILSNGLHIEYWTRYSERDHEEVKTEVITLTNNNESMINIEKFANEQFNNLYDEHRSSFKKLKEKRKDVYKKLAQTSPMPIAIDWELPQTIDFTLGIEPKAYEKHLYIPAEGKFKASLNNWESELINEELSNGAFAWLRNLDRKIWSLEIPYESNGIATPMYPDLIIVRTNKKGYIFDVLEPHDPSRNDNVPKAVGMAKFAEKHSDDFGRIQLIRKKKGADKREHFCRLDMCKLNIRNKVRSVSSDTELDKIFDDNGITEN